MGSVLSIDIWNPYKLFQHLEKSVISFLWLDSWGFLLTELLSCHFPQKNQLIWGSILCLPTNFAESSKERNAFETTALLKILLKPVKELENCEEREDNPPSTHMLRVTQTLIPAEGKASNWWKNYSDLWFWIFLK